MDSDDKYVYISPAYVSDVLVAAGVIASMIWIPSITNPQHNFLLSTYTPHPYKAEQAASYAGELMYGTYASYLHPKHHNNTITGVWFFHYHPGTKEIPGVHTPHSFFGEPTIIW